LKECDRNQTQEYFLLVTYSNDNVIRCFVFLGLRVW